MPNNSVKKTVQFPVYLDAYHRVEDGMNLSGIARDTVRSKMESDGLHDDFRQAVERVQEDSSIELSEAIEDSVNAQNFINTYGRE